MWCGLTCYSVVLCAHGEVSLIATTCFKKNWQLMHVVCSSSTPQQHTARTAGLAWRSPPCTTHNIAFQTLYVLAFLVALT